MRAQGGMLIRLRLKAARKSIRSSSSEESLSWLEPIQELGFTIVPGVLEATDIDGLLEELSRADLPRSRAGVRHAMRLPAVAAIAQEARMMGIARENLGRDAFPFRATLFDKSPAANWLVVWHQDTALPLKERREAPGWGPWSVKDGVIYAHAPESALSQVLALRLHLDDSLPENGPLRVLPGTHTLGVLSDEALHDLSTRVTAVDCLVPQGGILAMRPLIVHASSKSQSEAPRRVLHIEYAASLGTADGLELAIA
jgi:ectoine hydroxylase-related dioxygenase (phytanoyl-CoA dioxygenase family)